MDGVFVVFGGGGIGDVWCVFRYVIYYVGVVIGYYVLVFIVFNGGCVGGDCCVFCCIGGIGF